MCGSSHIRGGLNGAEYQNFCQTLDVYLLLAIWMGHVCKLQVCNLVLI